MEIDGAATRYTGATKSIGTVHTGPSAETSIQHGTYDELGSNFRSSNTQPVAVLVDSNPSSRINLPPSTKNQTISQCVFHYHHGLHFNRETLDRCGRTIRMPSIKLISNMSTTLPEQSGSTEVQNTIASNLKRKRSPSISSDTLLTATASKATKPVTNSFSINYLARSTSDDLPLIKKDETTSNLLLLLSQYSNVLDRQESLASNLGARPLGPILIKRFERCFDDPPKVIASHNSKHSATTDDTSQHITWLEVIEFARSHPAQFDLSTFSEGRRVCQFYYPQKQLRVQVSEEDFIFIKSGRCQELIPPLPIWEDEEKEVSTCEVLENKLKEVTNVADMIAARTRQLSHRIKNRKAAILERRAEGGSGTPARANTQQTTLASASNSREDQSTTDSLATKRNELLKHFESLPQNQLHLSNDGNVALRVRPRSSDARSVSPVLANTSSNLETNQSRPIQVNSVQRKSSSSNISSKHNFSKPLPSALENTQPFRPLCQAHMDSLPRGHRVLPPCDRCRRLRMDCVKNLTSCAGCTKKHARCHWRDVTRDEMSSIDHTLDSSHLSHNHAVTDQSVHEGDSIHTETDDDDSNHGLEDVSRYEVQHYATRTTTTNKISGTETKNDVTTAIRDSGSRPPSIGLRSADRENELEYHPHSSANPARNVAEKIDNPSQEIAPTSIGGFRAVNNVFPGTKVHGSI